MQKTRNPSCDSFARGFKSHPLRQKPGSPQAFRAFFLLRKVSFKSTKCTCLTRTVFYKREFEKHFQALYNSNRYNRGWEHSDKKRKKQLSTIYCLVTHNGKSYCTAESPSALFSLCLPFCCLYFKAVWPNFDLFIPCFARCKAGFLFVISNRDDRNDRLCQKHWFDSKKSKSNRLALFHFYIVALAFTPLGAALSAPCADRKARHSSQRSP